jgi:hypothetical protein
MVIACPSSKQLSIVYLLTPQETAMFSASDIYRAAHLMLHQYGEDA